MHDLDLILTLAGGLAAALALGYLTHRLGLSPIVGYLLAGVAVGPHTPGFMANRELAPQLAEIGVVLLMFGVGLHFHVKELLAVRRVAVPGAVGQIFAATLLGAMVAHGLGWGWSAGIVFGLAISVASTVVLIRVLADNRDLHTPAGHIAVGWLVVEDLFTVVALVLLPALVGEGKADPTQIALAIGLAGVKFAALVGFAFLVGGRVIPWMLEKIARTGSRELFTLTVLVLALGIAAGSAVLFGVSMALGAFLAGMVVGRSQFSLRAASEALPMRDAFAVLFFVAVGMLFDPRQLFESPGPIVATLAVILIGKPLAALVIVRLLGQPPSIGIPVGIALAQIGEFSFMVALLGTQLGILAPAATNTIVAAAIVSISLNPLLYRLGQPLERWASRQSALRWWFPRAPRAAPAGTGAGELEVPRDRGHRAVIVGYGPVGRTVSRLLLENDIEPTVIELDLEHVRELRAAGIPVVYGDASHRETLQKAGVDQAASLILSASGIRAPQEVIRIARELEPEIRVLARCAYVREAQSLREAGADVVFSGESEVALAFTVAILSELGAIPDQIDRERERVHTELMGLPSAFASLDRERRALPPVADAARAQGDG